MRRNYLASSFTSKRDKMSLKTFAILNVFNFKLFFIEAQLNSCCPILFDVRPPVVLQTKSMIKYSISLEVLFVSSPFKATNPRFVNIYIIKRCNALENKAG